MKQFVSIVIGMMLWQMLAAQTGEVFTIKRGGAIVNDTVPTDGNRILIFCGNNSVFGEYAKVSKEELVRMRGLKASDFALRRSGAQIKSFSMILVCNTFSDTLSSRSADFTPEMIGGLNAIMEDCRVYLKNIMFSSSASKELTLAPGVTITIIQPKE